MLSYIKDKLQGKVPKKNKRSSKWRKVRKEYLKNHTYCIVCGSSTKLEVHHIVPFHIAPEKELDVTNLMTLCENKKYGINCHLLMGHLGNYRRCNENVRDDAAAWRDKLGK